MADREELRSAPAKRAAYEEMRRLVEDADKLSDPDAVPLDDVGPGRSGVSLEQVIAEGNRFSASEEGEPGTGKRDPRIDRAAIEGMQLMRRSSDRSNSGRIVQSNLRCPQCFNEIGKAAPRMLMVEGAKTAQCPVCGKRYP